MKITTKNIKVLDKIKKGLIGIVDFLLTIPTKVFAIDVINIQPAYGVPPETRNSFDIIWDICKALIIPIAVFIGILIYLKKSKSSNKRKIIIVLRIIIIFSILNFIIINVT